MKKEFKPCLNFFYEKMLVSKTLNLEIYLKYFKFKWLLYKMKIWLIVLNLSLKFAEIEKANKDVVALIALLHDVDDYKLFGVENADNLTNARNILEQCSIADDIKVQVLNAIKTIGYRKRLKGVKPITLEGMIVSDADMCDGIGANGILRACMYHQKNNSPFFDKNIFPIEDMAAEKYKKCADSGVCHLFEKVLKLKDLMLTKAGKEEAKSRHQITIDFLYHFFDEENVPEWTEYLDNYLKERNEKLLKIN